jgi:hypothetical protein
MRNWSDFGQTRAQHPSGLSELSTEPETPGYVIIEHAPATPEQIATHGFSTMPIRLRTAQSGCGRLSRLDSHTDPAFNETIFPYMNPSMKVQ